VIKIIVLLSPQGMKQGKICIVFGQQRVVQVWDRFGFCTHEETKKNTLEFFNFLLEISGHCFLLINGARVGSGSQTRRKPLTTLFEAALFCAEIAIKLMTSSSGRGRKPSLSGSIGHVVFR
jgi:hypothetical protein